MEDLRGTTLATEHAMGVTDVGGFNLNLMPSSGDSPGSLISYLNSNYSILGENGVPVGLNLATRTTKNLVTGYVNGAAANGTDTDVSTGLPVAALYLLATNNNGTAAYFSNNTVAIVLVMDAVNETESAGLYKIFNLYMNRTR